jgi:hypothetical protein
MPEAQKKATLAAKTEAEVAPEAKPNEICTTADGVTFRVEVGGNLEELVEFSSAEVVYAKAKIGIASQAHGALKGFLAKHSDDGEKALEEMKNWAPSVGRAKVDPVIKAFAGIPEGQRAAYLEILAGMANNGAE